LLIGVTSFFADSNYFECGLWCAIGAGFLIRAALRRGRRAAVITAGVTFLLFGLSDFVEAHTGAWWRPWWLLVWKGLCLLVFLILLIRYIQLKKKSSPQKRGEEKPIC
jgi:hypothetical protein